MNFCKTIFRRYPILDLIVESTGSMKACAERENKSSVIMKENCCNLCLSKHLIFDFVFQSRIIPLHFAITKEKG